MANIVQHFPSLSPDLVLAVIIWLRLLTKGFCLTTKAIKSVLPCGVKIHFCRLVSNVTMPVPVVFGVTDLPMTSVSSANIGNVERASQKDGSAGI